jgi:glycosyltransferase involved in cell wall biosynthesis
MDALVSVIIPTYNGSRYIRETLDSVVAQEHRPMEIIVVDDGSSDDTPGVVEAYAAAHSNGNAAASVRLIRQTRKGHPGARNTGLRAAQGEFFAFVDHDDLWSLDKLALQLACFESRPELDLVFGHIQNFFTLEMAPEERARVRVPLQPLPGLLQGAMLARRDSFERVGYFYEERSMGDFVDWYGRATLTGLKSEMLEQTVLRRRIHAANFGRRYGQQRREYLLAVKDLLDRRRGVIT